MSTPHDSTPAASSRTADDGAPSTQATDTPAPDIPTTGTPVTETEVGGSPTTEARSGITIEANPISVPPKKSRNKTMRDMVLSMGLLVVVVLLFVGINGGFTFSPGTPTDSGPVPTADATGEFAKASRTLPFSPIVPQSLPASWHANSATHTDPDGLAAGTPLTVRGGWLIPDGKFIALIATNSDASTLLASEFGAAGTEQGTVVIDGASWTVTTGVREEQAWFRSIDKVTYLITGSAEQSAFHTLAAAVHT